MGVASRSINALRQSICLELNYIWHNQRFINKRPSSAYCAWCREPSSGLVSYQRWISIMFSSIMLIAPWNGSGV